MPKSKRRKVNGRPVRMTTTTPGALIAKRHVAMMCDDLDDLMRAVPLTYDSGSVAEAVEHHHATTAVVAWIREHNLTDMLAAMAGGDMVVVDQDPGTPTVKADIVQSPTTPGVSLDNWTADELQAATTLPNAATSLADRGVRQMSYAEMIAAQIPTTGGQVHGPIRSEGFSPVQTIDVLDDPAAGFTDDTATLERIADRSWVSDPVLAGAVAIAATGLAIKDAMHHAGRRPCVRCGREIMHRPNGTAYPHKTPEALGTAMVVSAWC